MSETFVLVAVVQIFLVLSFGAGFAALFYYAENKRLREILERREAEDKARAVAYTKARNSLESEEYEYWRGLRDMASAGDASAIAEIEKAREVGQVARPEFEAKVAKLRR